MLYKSRRVVAVRLSISNNHRGVLDWIKDKTGVGAVQTHPRQLPRHAVGYYWECNSQAAESVLRQIRLYLIVKSAQADLAIATMERLRDPVYKAERAWQEDWKEQMRELNKRRPREMLISSAEA